MTQIDGVYIELGKLKEILSQTNKKHITLSEGAKVVRIDVDKTQEKLELFKNVLPSNMVTVGVSGELVFE